MVCMGIGATARAQEEGEEEERTNLAESYLKTRPVKQDVVQARFFTKKNRLEIFPHLYSGALTNQFANRFLVLTGVGVAYHFKESFFVEGLIDYYPDIDAAVRGVCGAISPSSSCASYDGLKSLTRLLALQVDVGKEIPLVPKESLYLGGAVGFSPIYGKINLVSSYVQTFDVSLLAGLGLLRIYEDRYQVSSYDQVTGVATLEGPLAPRTAQTYPSPSLGLTIRLFLTHSLTLRADARLNGYVQQVTDYENPYTDPTTGATAYPLKNAFRDSFFLTAGVSGFLPFR